MNDESALKYVKKHLKTKQDVSVIDLGAFLGKYAQMLHDLLPCARVYTIEACPVNFKSLKKNVSNLGNVFPHNIAICDQCCRTKIFVAKHKKYKSRGTSQANSLFESFLVDKPWAKPKAVDMPGLTLSAFCELEGISHVDYLKINCEGCEYKIFDGPLEFLNMTSIMYLQLHSKSKEFTSKSYVKKRKAIEKKIIDSGMKLVGGSRDYTSSKHIAQLWSRL